MSSQHLGVDHRVIIRCLQLYMLIEAGSDNSRTDAIDVFLEHDTELNIFS